MAGIRKPLIVGENDLATLRPDLLLDWDWENNCKSPEELQLSSNYIAYWICHECGHKWACRLDSRTKNNHGCPMCARSKGSSVADYTLYKLLELSLDCEVLYRYNAVVGCEADVYIPSKSIVIEYDGYGFHKYESKKEKDLEKEEKFSQSGLNVYRIIERQDRYKHKEIEGNIVYIPEMCMDSFEYLKESLVEVVTSWGIIGYDDIPNEFFELDLQSIRLRTSKPTYERSLACALNEREDLFWDYDKNGDLKPEDIFRSIKNIKVWLLCNRGHSFQTTPRAVNDGFKCRDCSAKENKNYDNIDIAYNLSLIFSGFRDLEGSLSQYDYLNMQYTCPFCGTDGEYRLGHLFSSKYSKDYCKCTKNLGVVKVTILGKDVDNRVYYCVNALERYFLGIANDVNSDVILSKLNVNCDIVNALDIGLFRKYLKDPYIMKTTYNSVSTIPINKEKSNFVVSDEGVESCLIKLKLQKDEGLRIEIKEGFPEDITKKQVVDYFKHRFEGDFGVTFACNRTIGGINTSLACKSKNMYLVVKPVSCNKKYYDSFKILFDNYKNDSKMFFLSSYSDCVDESKGFFYLPETVFDIDLESVLEGLYQQFLKYYNII